MILVPQIQHPTATEYFFAEGCFITEWWNSTADMAVSLARARVEPGVTTRWHRLRGVTERYLILEGQGRVEVGELPPEAVGPGAVVLIPPGIRQRITNTGEGDLLFLAVCTPRFTRTVYQDLELHGGSEGTIPIRPLIWRRWPSRLQGTVFQEPDRVMPVGGPGVALAGK